ncbi:hypothetical protein [Actinosynnema sp.]|uniref:hypothetical protein n=1 Tax=Actinosynnema sp. TaxID=1872144 RepID=UPI003F87A4E1
MTATELGFDEDEGGLVDEQEIALGTDTHCVSAKSGFTAYGWLREVLDRGRPEKRPELVGLTDAAR